MTEATTMREQLDQAAELMATYPVEQWGPWMAYLLKVLGNAAQERDEHELYIAMLHALQRGISTWLDLGRW